jgi:hypothetical protein
MSNLDEKNLVRQKMSEAAKAAFIQKFIKEVTRGLRGGVSEDELHDAVNHAIIKDVRES